MEDKVEQISKLLESYSNILDPYEARSSLYVLQKLSKEIPQQTFNESLRQALLKDLNKGSETVLGLTEEIQPDILGDENIKQKISELRKAQKDKGWTI